MAGFEVTLVEKNTAVGGRARALEQDGFRFDMGPTWYWMPEVFEQFFQQDMLLFIQYVTEILNYLKFTRLFIITEPVDISSEKQCFSVGVFLNYIFLD